MSGLVPKYSLRGMGRSSLARDLRGVTALIALLSAPAIAQPSPVPLSVSPASTKDVADYGQSEEMKLGKKDDRMTVAVSIGGQGPYPFVIDTGAERTVISRQLADRLQLHEAKRVIIHGVANTLEVRAVEVPVAAIGLSRFAVAQAPLFEATNIGAAGLLGVDALRGQRVLINFKRGLISVSPSSAPIERTDGHTIIVQATSYHGRLMFKHAMAGTKKTLMVIDTGSEYTIGNLELLAKLGRHVDIDPRPVMIETVTGQSVAARIGKIDSFVIDDIRLTDIYVAFAAASGFKALGLEGKPALLLGMNVMRAFDRVSIDFAQRRVRFTFPRQDSTNIVRIASTSGSDITRFH